jgi:hypothetical protein
MIHFNKSREKIERISFSHKNDREWQCYIVLCIYACSTIVQDRIEQEGMEDKRNVISRGSKRVVVASDACCCLVKIILIFE